MRDPDVDPIHCCLCDQQSPQETVALPWNWQDWLQRERDLDWIPGSYRMPVCRNCHTHLESVRSGGDKIGPDPDSTEAATEILDDVIVSNLEAYDMVGDRL